LPQFAADVVEEFGVVAELEVDTFNPCEYGARDRERHRAEVVQRLVAIEPLAQVRLRDRVQAETFVEIDQQLNLGAVARTERQLLERAAPRRDLSGERLIDGREFGKEDVQQRPRG